MAVNTWKKFQLLMWKNWTIEKHHKIQFIFEISLPLIFVSFLLIFRNEITPSKDNNFITYEPENLDDSFSYLR